MNVKYWLGLGVLLLLQFSLSVSAGQGYQSEYAGQEHRKIKSLSADDINELTKGGGWGLAKVAELNGVPGPAHILEMADEIHLTVTQEKEIQKIFNGMKAEAMELGEKLIQLEMELNTHFANRTISQPLLEQSVHEIENVRAKLRIVHLSTHLKTPDILTNEQIVLYNELRGYSKDPCQSIPKGHNAEMWKRHNGCN